MSRRTAIIVGAGPAGLTAALELLERTDIRPIVLEMSEAMGGISRTVNYRGNRIDIGGHRFFSKSERVMNWWLRMLPLDKAAAGQKNTLTYQRQQRELEARPESADPAEADEVFLLRERTSRIYYLRKFFDYPISLSAQTLLNLGLVRTARIGLSYVKSAVLPIADEKNLEHFLINRFGRELYLTFFKSYTEKVWGTACENISADWGAQRIKGLNVTKALTNAVMSVFRRKDLAQKNTETSLIEQFLYPKFGPGQMWEKAAEEVKKLGGEILTGYRVVRVQVEGGRVKAVVVEHAGTGERRTFEGDLFFSTMPMQELVRSMDCEIPGNVREVAEGLLYRDFMTVGLLLSSLKLKEPGERGNKLVKDNWIYIQEPEVQVGRLQIFNNWSPYMVADPKKVWIGLEYFCNEGDALWKRDDASMIALAKEELERIDIIDPSCVEDAVVLRQPKTYPAYFGSYERFGELRGWLDGIRNLYLIGRNGMHKYNNQDHSMLTAMTAVDNLVAGIEDKSNIWDVNTESEYHEEKERPAQAEERPAQEGVRRAS